jgi:hypothetical protein
MFDFGHGRHYSVNLPNMSTVILPNDWAATFGQNTDMLKDILDRIDQRLKAVNLTEAAASKLAVDNYEAIRNIRRKVKENNEKAGVSTTTLFALAPVLETTASWLLEGSGPEVTSNPEARLRSAMLAFGVDREDLGRAVSAVKVFVDDHDAQSSQALLDDQSAPSNRHHAKEPSR